MEITTIGIDLAKEVFQTRGVGKHGKTVLCKQPHRGEMVKFFVNKAPRRKQRGINCGLQSADLPKSWRSAPAEIKS